MARVRLVLVPKPARTRLSVSALGAEVRRQRWCYTFGWPYGTQLRPGWSMCALGRWTREELDRIRTAARDEAERLRYFIEE